MITPEELNAVFETVGNNFDFETVSATYAPYRDLKIRWARTMDAIEFFVTDYLQEAPIEAVEGIATVVCKRINEIETEGYPDVTEKWLTSEEFRHSNQSRYIERSRSIDAVADTSRLYKAYESLVGKKLIGPIDDLKLFWSMEDRENKAGQSSCLMRVVIMNQRLNDDTIPSDVLEYSLLKQLANVNVYFGSEQLERQNEIDMMIAAFPERDEAVRWLEGAGMET